MAKHGKKKLTFSFSDIEFASFFLDFIRKKDFYTRMSCNMNRKGMMEFSITGNPENVKHAIIKIKKLHQQASKKYLENEDFIQQDYDYIAEILADEQIDQDDAEEERIKLNLKKLKFNEK